MRRRIVVVLIALLVPPCARAVTLEEHAANFTSKDKYNPKFQPGRLAARAAFLAAKDDAVPVLGKIAMTAGNGFFRADALVILSQIDTPAAFGAMKRYLLDGTDYVYYRNHAMTLSGKRLVVRLLAKMKTPGTMSLLASALRGEGNLPVLVRAHVAEAFGDLRRPDEVGEIAKLLSAEEVTIRRTVAEALGRLADARAVPALRERAKDAYITVRALAARALGRIPGGAAVEALDALARDRYANVAIAAMRGLACHAGSDRAREILKTQLKGTNGRKLIEAVRALARLGFREGTGALVAADLKTQTNAVTRLRAIEVLGEVGDDASVAALTGLLASKESDERYLAALALGKLKAAGARDALTRLTKDADANVRDAATEALARIAGTWVPFPEDTLELGENAFTVFYGDSITGETIYRAQIVRAVDEGYPYATRWFDTRGQHGWSLTDVFKAPRDALVEWPDLLTTQYGMNDVGYASNPTYTEGIAKYRGRYENLLNVLARYRRSPARRLLITATGGNPTLPVTPGYWGNSGEGITTKRVGGKAEILRRETRSAIDLAGETGVDVADVNSPMRYRTRECLPRGLSHYLLGDGWHPSGYGGKVMALEVLKLIGHFPNLIGTASVNAATGKTSGVTGCTLTGVTHAPTGVAFTVESDDRPLLRRVSDFEVFGAVRSTGPLRQGIALLALKVPGLAAGDYAVYVDGARANRYSQADLAAGVCVHLDRDRMVELLAREQVQYLERAKRALPDGAHPALTAAIDRSLAKVQRALRHRVEIVPFGEKRERPAVNAGTFSAIYDVARALDAAEVGGAKFPDARWAVQHVLDTYSVVRVAPVYRGLEYGGPEVKLPIVLFFSNVFHAPVDGTAEAVAPDGWQVKLDAKPVTRLAPEGWVSFKGSVAGTVDRTKLVQILWAKVTLRTGGAAFEKRHPLVMRSAPVEVSGPFTAHSVPPRMRAAKEGALPREPAVAAACDGSAKGLKWKRVTSRVFQPRYVLANVLGYDGKRKITDGEVALVRLAFRSPRERECFLELNPGFVRAYQAILNGRALGYRTGFGRMPVRLKAGDNVLLVRVFPHPRNGASGLAFGFEFSDVDSIPFEDLSVIANNP